MADHDRRISFTALLATSFAILGTLPLVGLLILNQVRLEGAILASLDRQLEEVENHALDTVAALEGEATHVMPVVAATVASDLERYKGPSVDDVLHAAVAAVPAIDAMYVSFEDGTHRVVTRVDRDRRQADPRIPDEALWHSSWIDPFDVGTSRTRHRSYYAAWGALLDARWDEPSDLDLRALPHYRQARETGKPVMVEPEINPDTGFPVVSLAHPILVDGAFVGVVGVNLTFRHLSGHLARNRVSSNGLTVVLDQEGHIIAHPDPVVAHASMTGQDQWPSLSTLTQPAITAAAIEVATAQTTSERPALVERSIGGEVYHLLASPFSPTGAASWTVVTAAPESDFVGETRSALQTSALVILAITVLQVLLIAGFARQIGARIRGMSTRFRSIRRLQFEGAPSREARGIWIRELADLDSGFQLLLHSVETFSRFVPRRVVSHLVATDDRVGPSVESRQLALFFCDLQGFTSLAERADPDVLLRQINEYFDAVTSSIVAEGGTIDKFIGDAVMAFWGAPDAHPEPAAAAGRAALRVRHRFAALSKRWEAEGLPPLRLRIGVHYAPVLVGTIGTDVRLSYTALGDGVNVAARLEGANKELETAICVSDAIRIAAPDLMVRPLRPLTLKGRQQPLQVHELVGVQNSTDPELSAAPGTAARIACGEAVRDALERDNPDAARAALEAHLQHDPGDHAAQALLAWLEGRLSG